MRISNLLKVLTLLDLGLKLHKLGLEYIRLQVELDIVDEEGHVQSRRDNLGGQAWLVHLFQADLQAEALVQLHLDAAYDQEVGEDLVVLLQDLGRDECVEGPLYFVGETDATPAILA